MSHRRQQLVFEYINEKKSATVAELCEAFNASSATIRRDLGDLASRSMVQRTRGGAKSLESLQKYEPPYSDKLQMNVGEKARIAAYALTLIQEKDCIALDSSSTTYALAKLLVDSTMDITVVTNDMAIATLLAPNPVIELFVVGGTIRKGYYTSIGMFSENMWRQLYIDKLFLGVDAINAKLGLMNYRIEELTCKKLMLERSNKKYILCDHSKFTSTAVLQICPLNAVDMLITGTELPGSEMEKYNQIGVEIVRV